MEVLLKNKKGENEFEKVGFKNNLAVNYLESKFELVEKYNQEQDKINIEKIFNNSGIPKKYHNVKLSDISFDSVFYGPENKVFNLDFVNQFIKDVAEGKSRFLWLCGKPGTGKTTLAAAIVKEISKLQKSCKYYKSHEIMQRLEDSKRYSSKENVQMVVKDVTSSNFVVYDEIGRWPITEWEKFRIFEFANDLYENYKSAIFISNMTKVELRNFMGMAAVDRFLNGGTTVDFQGATYRGTKNELYTRG